jgi:outer membrane lipoprotein-sorting protein
MRTARVIALIGLLLFPHLASAVTAESILNQLEVNYKNINSLTCTVNEVVSGSWGQVESNYNIKLRMPDNLRADLTDGLLVITAQGGEVMAYYPKPNKAYLYTLNNFQGSEAVDILFNFLDEYFNAEYLGISDGMHKVKLSAKKQESSPYQEIYLWASQDCYINRLNLDDGHGLIINYSVSDQVLNPTLSDAEFVYTPPADCLYLEGGPIKFK